MNYVKIKMHIANKFQFCNKTHEANQYAASAMVALEKNPIKL